MSCRKGDTPTRVQKQSFSVEVPPKGRFALSCKSSFFSIPLHKLQSYLINYALSNQNRLTRLLEPPTRAEAGAWDSPQSGEGAI